MPAESLAIAAEHGINVAVRFEHARIISMHGRDGHAGCMDDPRRDVASPAGVTRCGCARVRERRIGR
jgi:hypothetical protein